MLFAVSFAVTFLPDVENQFVALMFSLGAAVKLHHLYFCYSPSQGAGRHVYCCFIFE